MARRKPLIRRNDGIPERFVDGVMVKRGLHPLGPIEVQLAAGNAVPLIARLNGQKRSRAALGKDTLASRPFIARHTVVQHHARNPRRSRNLDDCGGGRRRIGRRRFALRTDSRSCGADLRGRRAWPAGPPPDAALVRPTFRFGLRARPVSISRPQIAGPRASALRLFGATVVAIGLPLWAGWRLDPHILPPRDPGSTRLSISPGRSR